MKNRLKDLNFKSFSIVSVCQRGVRGTVEQPCGKNCPISPVVCWKSPELSVASPGLFWTIGGVDFSEGRLGFSKGGFEKFEGGVAAAHAEPS